jgi:hypothetical protein
MVVVLALEIIVLIESSTTVTVEIVVGIAILYRCQTYGT